MKTKTNQIKLYHGSICFGVVTIFSIVWWIYHMGLTNSGIDHYPSRWINSFPFITMVVVGCISGALFWASLFPWRYVRILILSLLGAIIPIVFIPNSYLWFEPYQDNWGSLSFLYQILLNTSAVGAILVIVGWILSIASSPFYITVVLLRTIRRKIVNFKTDINVDSSTSSD